MKGIFKKTEEGWFVVFNQRTMQDPSAEDGMLPLHPEYQTILPLDLDLDGKEIEFDWYYPYMNTPLWKDVFNYIHDDYIGKTKFIYNHELPISPEQQLVLVLPPQSFHLNPNIKYRDFVKKYPQFYPSKFGVHSLGKKWIYECESNIPIVSSKFIRKMVI